MKRNVTFVKKVGTVRCAMPDGQVVEMPIYPGILKHPTIEQLRRLLRDADVARKYTIEALRVAPWPVLRNFPFEWLRLCLSGAHLPPRRERAIAFFLL